MSKSLPRIIVTGASGFIGRNFLESMREKYYIFAIARRSGREAEIPFHPNIDWIQWDISNDTAIADIAFYIKTQGGVGLQPNSDTKLQKLKCNLLTCNIKVTDYGKKQEHRREQGPRNKKGH